MEESRSSRTLLVAITVTLGLLAPSSVLAQSVSGRVLDARSDTPVLAATVTLIDRSGWALLRNGGEGWPVPPGRGPVRLRLHRHGQRSRGPRSGLYLELRVQPAAVGLDPIRVTAPRTVPYLEGTGFYGRMRRGHGTFFSPRDLERAPSAFPTQFLRRVSGLSVRHDGSITIRGVTGFMGGPCSPTIVVDGMILRDIALDDVVPMPSIDAMEVYKGPATVPPQWRGAGVCGVIAVWTKH